MAVFTNRLTLFITGAVFLIVLCISKTETKSNNYQNNFSPRKIPKEEIKESDHLHQKRSPSKTHKQKKLSNKRLTSLEKWKEINDYFSINTQKTRRKYSHKIHQDKKTKNDTENSIMHVGKYKTIKLVTNANKSRTNNDGKSIKNRKEHYSPNIVSVKSKSKIKSGQMLDMNSENSIQNTKTDNEDETELESKDDNIAWTAKELDEYVELMEEDLEKPKNIDLIDADKLSHTKNKEKQKINNLKSQKLAKKYTNDNSIGQDIMILAPNTNETLPITLQHKKSISSVDSKLNQKPALKKEKRKDKKEVNKFYSDELDKEYDQFKEEVGKDKAIVNEGKNFKEQGGFRVAFGDMVLPKGQEEKTFNEVKNKATITNTANKWTMPVPYKLADQILTEASGKTKNAIILALKEIQDKSCISFKPWSGEASYLLYMKGIGPKQGCWSLVGKQPPQNQPQLLSLSVGCEHKSVAVHETLHALGFFHEQNRPDRDRYISIQKPNIETAFLGNFRKEDGSNIYNTPYDFTSVMQYPLNAFGRKLRGIKLTTMVPIEKKPLQISQPTDGGLSPYDRYELNKLYNCQKPQKTVFANFRSPRVYIISAVLLPKIEIFMQAYQGLNNYDFTVRLRNYLIQVYPTHYFVVLTYNRVQAQRSDIQAFVGYCVHKYAYYGRNCVVCHSSKQSSFPSKHLENEIWMKILHAARDRKSCNANDVRIRSWSAAVAESKRHGFQVALVFILRTGNGLIFNSPDHLHYDEYTCSQGISENLIMMFGAA